MIAILLTLSVVHLVASDAVFLVLRRILRGTDRPSLLRTFLLTRGLGPAVLAVATYTVLVSFPGRHRVFYLTVLAVVFLGPAALAASEWKELVSAYRTCWGRLRAYLRCASPLLIATLLVASIGAVISINLPIVEHDGLAAAVEARIALRDASFANYLAITKLDLETGYYMETFRPPFLQSLYVFYGWLGGMDNLDLLIRTTSAIFGFHCLILIAVVAGRHRSPRAGTWSAFLLVVTPIFFYVIYNNGIDTARLYLSFVALLWIVELTATGAHRVAVAAGGASGPALFCHLASAPVLAGGALAFLFFGEGRPVRRIVAAAILGAVTLVTGASFHYLLAPAVLNKVEQTFGSEGLYEIARMLPPQKDAEEMAEAVETPHAGSEKKPARYETIQIEPEVEGGTLVRPDRDSVEPQKHNEEEGPEPQEQEGPEQEEQPPTQQEETASAHDLAIDRHAALLELRGQGRSPLQQLIFGRLQMFTGIEHFGWIFFFFWIGVAVWFIQGRRGKLERVFAVSAVFTAFVVLSGIRQLSWSNPRYIASILPIAAYFAGHLVATVERHSLTTRWRKVLFVAFLVFPVALVTTVRGAKVEITNSGDFYGDFRSLRWVDYASKNPEAALTTLWNDYLGIRKTIRYFFADPDDKLRHAHDYFGAVVWIRDNLPEDAHVMVFRDARFFYYSNRYGTVWYSPRIDQRGYRYMPSPEVLQSYLRGLGITHVLVDDYSTRLPGYADRWTGEMLADERLAEKVYEFGTARVYRLLGPPVEPIEPPFSEARVKPVGRN